MEYATSITSSIVFYITPTQILFMVLAALAIGEEILLHFLPIDFMFWGGLYAGTLFVPVLILIATGMSQRVSYTRNEQLKFKHRKNVMVHGHLVSFATYQKTLAREFNPKKTLKWTIYCIAGVLGLNLIGGALHLGIVYAVEYGFFSITLAIVENLACQVATIIGLTAMLLYPRKMFGIPCALLYLGGFIAQGIETNPQLRIAINVIPIIAFAMFFPFAKREIESPSKGFNFIIGLTSAGLFFAIHFTVYWNQLFVWLGLLGDGLVMAFVYLRTKNVAITTWAHVLLNIITLPALILTMQYFGLIT
jgi:hypothetical protein